MGDFSTTCRVDVIVSSMACHLPPWPLVAATRATARRAISRQGHVSCGYMLCIGLWTERRSWSAFCPSASQRRPTGVPMNRKPWLISLLFFHHPATAHSVMLLHIVMCVCCVRSYDARPCVGSLSHLCRDCQVAPGTCILIDCLSRARRPMV